MSTKTLPSSHLVNGEWIPGAGDSFVSTEPGSGAMVWTGNGANESEVASAIQAAADAFPAWYGKTLAERIEIAERYRDLAKQKSEELALLISREVGKPLWESRTEAAAVVGKVQLAVDALKERRWEQEMDLGGYRAVTRYRPHGVLAVLGPFNFPAHLPNGHILPALLAGNTVVLKPSEMTPGVGAWMAQNWVEAGIPAGVVNLVQGGLSTGIALSRHPRIDGLLFTGSSRAGVSLHDHFGGQPEKILALEMGGNNPLIVEHVKDLKAAAYLIALSAYLTSGQRCTCARRLILVEDHQTDQLIREIQAMIGSLRVGFFDQQPEPFMGTVISPATGRRLLEEQQVLLDRGAQSVVPMQSLQDCEALLSPGLVEVTGIERDDEELFGPFLGLTRVDSLDRAIQEANQTRYGLSAGLISDSRNAYEQFIHEIRAGVVNWNRQTTGASGKLPFGGCGLSGNHRPSGYFATDYCSFPIASMESETVELPDQWMPGIEATT